MGSVAFINPIEDPAWAALVASSPTAEVFHHPRWLELLQAQYGYEVSACCVRGEDGIEAALPLAHVASRLTGNRLVSLPFSDVCSPLLSAGADVAALGTLGDVVAAHAADRGLELTVHSAMPGIPGGFVSERFVTHELALPEDPDVAERGASKSLRRGVAKARRERLRAERRTDGGALDAFYRLHLLTRRRLGVPTQPKRFIARFEELFDAGLGAVWLVLDGAEPVAAAVFLVHNETVTYKYGASATAALPKRPNNLLMLEAIRWSCANGFRKFDFGRTDLDNEGLRRFKCSWGAEELPLSYTYLTRREPAVAGAASIRERVMAKTIRRSPAVVGRLAGEMLYRHVG
ncbi:MAG TPA: GNAT family N-acetyltransferase [Solirubrobacterales bacterium]|nr:GNAT family N-acetyltransferase [Solirubrobacterales bacterium]